MSNPYLDTNGLCDAIREFLAEELKNVQLPSEGRGERVSPRIIDTYLPPKRSNGSSVDDQFPWVIVRPSEGEVSVYTQNEIKVRIIVGVRDIAPNSHRWAFLLLDLIQHSFLRAAYVGAYSFKRLKWTNFDDQQDPFYELYIDTWWDAPLVQGGFPQ